MAGASIAFFVPAIVYLADAIGTQSEAIAVRGRSLSHAPLKSLIWDELRTGLLIGAALEPLAWRAHRRSGMAVAADVGLNSRRSSGPAALPSLVGLRAATRQGTNVKLNVEWTRGNRIQLLENGDVFFPSVFAAIAAAEREILIETFILFDDRVGRGLQQHLIEAAARHVEVDLTVDGFGSPGLSADFVSALTHAGVRLHVYEPTPVVRQLKPLRRLHRKIVVVDGRIAFVGGINYSEDHLEDFGPKAKQDYSVRIEGPLVREIRRLALQALEPVERKVGTDARAAQERVARAPGEPGNGPLPGRVEAALVVRDNRQHRNDIEKAYRMAIRAARHSVVIGNAYFFPGYRLIRDLRRAAQRGVRVQLVLQKEPDVAIARTAARLLYESLLKDGVEVHEYCRREMHGKVAVVDRFWATVGSANLDPLSLSLNLEANVMVRDAQFAAELERRLQQLIEHDCERLNVDALPRLTMWRYLMGSLAYHVARSFPRWLRALQDSPSRIRSFVRGRRVDTETALDGPAHRD